MGWLRFLVGLLVLFPAVVLAEADIVGSIKIAQGSAVVVRDGALLDAHPGLRLQRSDVLRTGEDGRLGVIFRDDTIVSLGNNTELAIEEFAFAPGEGRLGLVLRLLRGMASFLSGSITKLAPEAVRIETPVGTVGVRGTRFLVRVDG